MSGVTRAVRPEDLPAVDRIFRTSFVNTFGHLYSPDNLQAFLSAFTPDAWVAELADPGMAFRLAEDGGVPVGFAKVGAVKLPVDTQRPALELHQLYLLPQAHGTGLGAALMDWVLAEARARGAEELYLSVFTQNPRAQRFYARYGFEPFAPYHFMVGDQADEDVIMRLAL